MTDRIVEYHIVSGFEPDLLELINTHIEQGWQPYGNLIRDPYGCYYQAIVRTHNPPIWPMNGTYTSAEWIAKQEDEEIERLR